MPKMSAIQRAENFKLSPHALTAGNHGIAIQSGAVKLKCFTFEDQSDSYKSRVILNTDA